LNNNLKRFQEITSE